MHILNLYHRDLANPGDLASSPLRCFSFACDTTEFGAGSATPEAMPRADALIVGGGGLIQNETFQHVIDYALDHSIGPKILWGAGFNYHSYPFNFARSLDGFHGLKGEIRGLMVRRGLRDRSDWAKQLLKDSEIYPTIDSRYDLVGVRDWVPNYRWVPCVSCMHPLFDEARGRRPIRNLTIIDHPLFFAIKTVKHVRTSNLNLDFEALISQIADAEVVLTSSYHAAYWAILLNRRVVVVPWSTKFLQFRWPIQLAFDLDGVRSAIRKSVSFPDALSEARAANLAFAQDVSSMLSVPVALSA